MFLVTGGSRGDFVSRCNSSADRGNVTTVTESFDAEFLDSPVAVRAFHAVSILLAFQR